MTDKDALLRECARAIDDLAESANIGVYDPLLTRITAALDGGNGNKLRMHDRNGRHGFPFDEDPMDEGDNSWCIDPDMGAR